MRYLAGLLAFAALPAVADTTVGPEAWNLYRGTSIVARDFPTKAACVQAADDRNELRNFTCRTSVTVAVTADAPPPPPSPDPTVCVGAVNTPGGSDGMNGCFPGPLTTGVPQGTTLTAYTGSCMITAADTVIDAKTINCNLTIRAAGVKIARSVVNGTIYLDASTSGSSFEISDSQINIGDREGTGIGDANFVARRVRVTGGNRSINCYRDCTVEDSYVHGQFRDATGRAHESGIRINTNSRLIHNSIACDAPDVPPDAGCSAAVTGYPDFDPVSGNTLERNLIVATTGGFCSYHGATATKPFSNHAQNATNIVVRDNVYQRGNGGKCGYYGYATDFARNRTGNVWSGNKWDNGADLGPP